MIANVGTLTNAKLKPLINELQLFEIEKLSQ